MKKSRCLMFAGLISVLFPPMARADLAKAGEEIKETAVDVAKKTAQVGREIGHATAETAKTVGHAVADGARKGYEATRQVVTNTSASHSNPPPEDAKLRQSD